MNGIIHQNLNGFKMTTCVRFLNYQLGLSDNFEEKILRFCLNFSVPPSTTYDTQNASNNDLSTGRPSEGTSMLSQQLFKAAFGDNSLQQGNEIYFDRAA